MTATENLPVEVVVEDGRVRVAVAALWFLIDVETARKLHACLGTVLKYGDLTFKP